jgi:hypothetical protein
LLNKGSAARTRLYHGGWDGRSRPPASRAALLALATDGRKGIYGNIVIRKSMNEEAYAILEDFDLSLLKLVYEMAGKEALKDDEKLLRERIR